MILALHLSLIQRLFIPLTSAALTMTKSMASRWMPLEILTLVARLARQIFQQLTPFKVLPVEMMTLLWRKLMQVGPRSFIPPISAAGRLTQSMASRWTPLVMLTLPGLLTLRIFQRSTPFKVRLVEVTMFLSRRLILAGLRSFIPPISEAGRMTQHMASRWTLLAMLTLPGIPARRIFQRSTPFKVRLVEVP